MGNANCVALPTANAGQYATSHCKPLLFGFPCKRRFYKCPNLYNLCAKKLKECSKNNESRGRQTDRQTVMAAWSTISDVTEPLRPQSESEKMTHLLLIIIQHVAMGYRHHGYIQQQQPYSHAGLGSLTSIHHCQFVIFMLIHSLSYKHLHWPILDFPEPVMGVC